MKKAIITMGLPASGKSTMMQEVDTTGYITFDADEVKKVLIGSKGLQDTEAIAMMHELSSKISKRLLNKSIEEGHNVIIDTCGDNVSSMIKKVDNLLSHGYDVEIFYKKVSVMTSLKRNAKRSRRVPYSIIKQKAERINNAYKVYEMLGLNITVVCEY